MDRGPYIVTATGRQFFPFDPRPANFWYEDIAYGLAHVCRYAGQIKRYYSVAEHCWHASNLVPPEFAFEALLHDAAEAFPPGDIVTPVKKHPVMRDAREVQKRIDVALRRAHRLPVEESPEVKAIDCALFVAEARQLGHDTTPDFWTTGHRPDSYGAWIDRPDVVKIKCWSPARAKYMWQKRFEELWWER